MKNDENKIYETYSFYGDKFDVQRKRISDTEYYELTIDYRNKLYSLERLQGNVEPTEYNFDGDLARAQQEFKQVSRSELGENERVVTYQMDITDAELDVLHWCIRLGEVKIATIQYYGKIRFMQAAWLLEWMQQKQYVDSSLQPSNKYKVTLTEEQFNAIYKRN